jgi:hypothetical protein
MQVLRSEAYVVRPVIDDFGLTRADWVVSRVKF